MPRYPVTARNVFRPTFFVLLALVSSRLTVFSPPTPPLIPPQVKFRDYAKAIAETKANMSSDAASAFFSLTQAEYAAGNFKNKVAEGPMTARIRVGAGVDNVAGVKIPVFTLYETGVTADNQSLGLVGGGKKIQNVREKFTGFIEMLIKLASLQTSFVTLDEALKVTNRRVNALENVTIPKIQGVLDYISRELDELEREGEFFEGWIVSHGSGSLEDRSYTCKLTYLPILSPICRFHSFEACAG